MVGHGHSGSLPGVDVSSRVVVTLSNLLLSAFLCGREIGEEEEEERGAQRPQNLLLQVRVEEKLHCAVALGARTASDWQRAFRLASGTPSSSSSSSFTPPGVLAVALLPSSGAN